MKLAVCLMVLIVTQVCVEATEDIQNALLDQEFTMKIGQQVEIKQEKLRVKFTSLLEDSRCPKGEQCITQGNARIELQLIKGAEAPGSVSLNTASDSSETDYHGYTIRLISLNPYPVMNKSIRAEDYEAVLEVTLTKNRE